MESRGGTEWVRLLENGKLKHFFTPGMESERKDPDFFLKNKIWDHTYYLDTLLNVHKHFS